jgi:hypothetical protein
MSHYKVLKYFLTLFIIFIISSPEITSAQTVSPQAQAPKVNDDVWEPGWAFEPYEYLINVINGYGSPKKCFVYKFPEVKKYTKSGPISGYIKVRAKLCAQDKITAESVQSNLPLIIDVVNRYTNNFPTQNEAADIDKDKSKSMAIDLRDNINKIIAPNKVYVHIMSYR